MATRAFAQTTKKGRIYYRPSSGESAPSVTTILDVIAKPALTRWASRQAAEFAVRQRHKWEQLEVDEAIPLIAGSPWNSRDRAAHAGTSGHEVFEALLLGQPIPAGADMTFASRLEAWVVEHTPDVILMEEVVWGYAGESRLPYAGSFDLICDLDGQRWLIDLKTGKGVYAETKLQLAAYAAASTFILEDESELDSSEVPIDRYGVLHVPATENRAPRLIEMEITPDEVTAFIAARELWQWREGSE